MKRFKFLILLVVAALLLNCSSDDSDTPEPQVTIAEFEGSWKASSARFTNNNDASENIDFIAAGGSIRYTMLSDGRVRTWIDFQNNVVDEWDALVTLGPNNTFTSTPAESSRPVQRGTYALGNNTITLTNENDRFDFTLSGEPEVSATSVIVFVPNN